MANTALGIKCRIGELPTVAGIILGAFTADYGDFEKYSKNTYNTAFTAKAEKLLEEASNIISPRQYTGELKVITQRIYSNQMALYQPIDFLEGYLNKAVGLKMDAADFGISEVRTKNNNGDIEGLTTALNFLLTNTAKTENLAALKLVGYDDAQQKALQKLHDDLLADNIAQAQKMRERKLAVSQNYKKFNELVAVLKDICTTGKILYKRTAPEKLDGYTMTRIFSKIRNEQKKTLLNISVTVNGKPGADAVVTLTPEEGGRGTKITMDAAGKGSKAGLSAGAYTGKCVTKGFPAQPVSVEVETNKDSMLEIEFK